MTTLYVELVVLDISGFSQVTTSTQQKTSNGKKGLKPEALSPLPAFGLFAFWAPLPSGHTLPGGHSSLNCSSVYFFHVFLLDFYTSVE